MNSQGGHPFQIQLLLACRTISIDPAFHIAMLLKKMLRKLIGVEEYIKTDLASKDAPLVLLYQVSPHLETVLKLLSTKFTLGLVCCRLLLFASEFEFPPGRHELFEVRLIGWFLRIVMIVHF